MLRDPGQPVITDISWKTIDEPIPRVQCYGLQTSIADLTSFESKQLVFKSLNKQAPQCIYNLFQRNSQCSSRNLRNTVTDLRLPISTSLNGQKSFFYLAAKLGNTLAREIKQATFQFSSKSFFIMKTVIKIILSSSTLEIFYLNN